MDSKIAKLYRTELEHLRSFMEGKVARSKRKTSAWSDEEKALQIQRNPFCKTCDEKLTLQNITREHIHPLCLGGFENPKNVIPMCDKCNSARNEVMKDAIGFVSSSAIKKRWPGNKRSVESFLVWAFATINGDQCTVNYFSELNESFSYHRGMDLSLLPHKTSIKIPAKEGFFSTIRAKLNGIFQYKDKLNGTSQKEVQAKEVVDCVCGARVRINLEDHGHKNGSFRCKKCNHVLKIIANSSVPIPDNNEQSKKDSTAAESRKNGNTKTQISQGHDLDSFPLMIGINSLKGLNLPREPSAMLNSICWIMSSDLEFENWKEMLDDLEQQSILKPKKITRMLIHLTCWFSKDEFNKQNILKFKQKLRESEINDLITKIENECKNHSSISDSEYQNVSLYFDEVRKLNSIAIMGFNSSRGLKLPSKSSALTESIVWLKTEVEESESFNYLKEKFEVSGIVPKSRARYIISFIFRSLKQDVELPIKELFALTKEEFSQISIPDLCLKMFTKSKCYQKLGFVENDMQRVRHYFYEVANRNLTF